MLHPEHRETIPQRVASTKVRNDHRFRWRFLCFGILHCFKCGRIHFVNIEVIPAKIIFNLNKNNFIIIIRFFLVIGLTSSNWPAAPPRTIFVAESSILLECPRTIPRKPVKSMKPPKPVKGVEWPKQNLTLEFIPNN